MSNNTITVTGSALEIARKTAALNLLNELCNAEQLEKLARMANNPIYKAMLKTVK